MAVLAERVLHHRFEALELTAKRNDLPADGAVGVVPVHECGKIRRDVQPETVPGRHAFLFFRGEVDNLAQFVSRVQTVLELPAPIILLFQRHVAPRTVVLALKNGLLKVLYGHPSPSFLRLKPSRKLGSFREGNGNIRDYSTKLLGDQKLEAED
jgi:hypothetical protein